jgi:hypothetical protein
MRGLSSALNAGVMRRFERVVALPDPKNCVFPAESTASPVSHAPESTESGQVNDNQPLRLRGPSCSPHRLSKSAIVRLT